MNSASSFCIWTASTQGAVSDGQHHPHVLAKEPTSWEPANPSLCSGIANCHNEAKKIHTRASH